MGITSVTPIFDPLLPESSAQERVGSKVFGPDGQQTEDDQRTHTTRMTDGKHMQISGRRTDDGQQSHHMTRPCNVTWADCVRNGKYQVKGMTVKQ